MNGAEGGIAVAHGIGDDAHGQQVVNLTECTGLPLRFQMNGVKALDAAFYVGGQAVFSEILADVFLHLGQEALKLLAAIGDFAAQFGVGDRFQIAKGQVFEIAADGAHAQPVGDGSVNIERLAGDTRLLFRPEKAKSAHVVQPVSQLDQYHADVADHGQEHFAHAFHLADFRGEQLEAADLGDSFDQACDFTAEPLGDFGQGNMRILDDVMQQGGAEGSYIQTQIRQYLGDLERMGKIGLAGVALLGTVVFGGEIKGATQQIEIVLGAIAPEAFDQGVEPLFDVVVHQFRSAGRGMAG